MKASGDSREAVDPSTRAASSGVIDVFTTVVPPTSAVVVVSVGTVVDSEGSTEVGAAVVGATVVGAEVVDGAVEVLG